MLNPFLSSDQQAVVVFLLWKTLGYWKRMFLGVGCILGGLFLQYYYYHHDHYYYLYWFEYWQSWLSLLLLFVGNLFLMVRGFDNRIRFGKYSPEAEWENVIDVNLKGTFLCCQAVGKGMIAQGGGKIINIASLASVIGIPAAPAYAASKGGVVQLTKALALEWAREGITVNAIGAGWFSETDKTGMAQEDSVLRYLPLRRYGHPSEIGSLVVYLASDAAEFYTGQFLHVDGAVMVHG